MQRLLAVTAFGFVLSSCAQNPPPNYVPPPRDLPKAVTLAEQDSAATSTNSICTEAIASGQTSDIKALLSSLSVSSLQKGQTETTDEHKARLQALLAKGGAQGPFTARLVRPSLFKYEADTQVLTIRPLDSLTKSAAYFPGQRGTIVPLISETVSTRKYPGQNAYGAQVEVTEIQQAEIAAALDFDGEGKPSNALKRPYDMHWPLSKAKSELSDLAVIFGGDLIAPYAIEGRTLSKATIDTPIAMAINSKAVVMRVSCVAVFSTSSKQVLRQSFFTP